MERPDYFPTRREIEDAAVREGGLVLSDGLSLEQICDRVAAWAVENGIRDRARILEEILGWISPEAPPVRGSDSGNATLMQEINYHGTGPYSGDYDSREEWH